MITQSQNSMMIRFSICTLFLVALFVSLGWANSVHAQSSSRVTQVGPSGTVKLEICGNAGDDKFKLTLTGQITGDAGADQFLFKGTSSIIIPDLIQYNVPVQGQLNILERAGLTNVRLSFAGKNESEQAAIRLEFESSNVTWGDGILSGHGKVQGKLLVPSLPVEFLDINAPAGISIIIDDYN
ncbi:MAG: hypothetical protein AAF702_17995 [Chloroflexota bacterium]